MLQVIPAAPEIMKFTVMCSIQAKGEGIDGEIAPEKIQLDTPAFHRGQGGGILVVFCSGGN